MILQKWIEDKNSKIMVVERYNGDNASHIGCVFLPGLGQSKAGLYFLYTIIAEMIYHDIPTLQVDYSGFGDSMGTLHECSMESIMDSINQAVGYFKEKHSIWKLIFVSSGFANAMVLDYVLDKVDIDYEIVLIKPFLLGTLFDEYYSKIDMNYINSNQLLDTAYIIDWDMSEDLFKWLGAGRNRTKGLIIHYDFFMYIAKCSVIDKLKSCKKKILIITSNGNEALQNDFDTYDNLEWYFSNKEDPNMLNMMERKAVINKIVEWILNHCES